MKSEMPQYNPSISPSLNLINALIHIKENGPWVPHHGICVNIYTFFDQTKLSDRIAPTKMLYDVCQNWPKAVWFQNLLASDFPVGGAEEYVKESRLGTLWQNPRRLELLDFIIDYLNTKG